MYAKVFTQILDSSLAEDYEIRHVFEDLLKLADMNGVVDMTPESISRRLNCPLEIVLRGISTLEKPDTKSRTPDHEGRRIVKLDEHRAWGWFIVNYEYYRSLASEEQRREKTKLRTQKWRNKQPKPSSDAPVTHVDASDAMQMQMQKQKQMDIDSGGTRVGWTEKETEEQWAAAQGWLADWQKNGADYTEFEARGAFLALQANGWMWGRNPITDPRAALERQIQTDRDRKNHGSNRTTSARRGEPAPTVKGSSPVNGF